jgi:hypothetical protein
MLRRFLGLDRDQQVAVARTTALLLAARVALRTIPFRRVLRFVGQRPTGPTPPISPLEDPGVQRTLWALEAVGNRLFPRNPCLTQAVVAQRLLLRRGWPAELRIGVRKGETSALEAHAWVESGGKVVMGSRGFPEQYIPFPVIESSSSPTS